MYIIVTSYRQEMLKEALWIAAEDPPKKQGSQSVSAVAGLQV